MRGSSRVDGGMSRRPPGRGDQAAGGGGGAAGDSPGPDEAAAASVGASRSFSGPGGSSVSGGGVVPGTASTKPQSPKDGTSTWYGVVANPAARTVASTHQYSFCAKYGEPDCTTTRPPSARAWVSRA